MPNIRNLLGKIRYFGKPRTVPADVVKQGFSLSQQERDLLKRFGLTSNELSELLHRHSQISYDRHSLAVEIERALAHPLMGAAVEAYAETATNYNRVANATIWVTSSNRKYEAILNKLLDSIGIEEKIFDWAWTTAAFGDLFIGVEAQNGLGIINIDDSEHPLNVSRLDYNGRLIGFFRTPMGGLSTEREIIEPWKYVHCRLLGAKRRRPIMGDPLYTEFASVNIMMPTDKRRMSTKYGTSVLLNALPIYKRLRLAEDSLMLARLSKGLLRYIYKLQVDGSSAEPIAELIDEYKTLLKKARAVNLDPNAPYFGENYESLGLNEDIIVPVWGDVNNLQIEKIGGEADIRFIVDIEELRNQLSAALRVPLQILGGYVSEMPQGLGRSALERYDIRFARQVRRLQRALIDAVKRLCQIHLAYQGYDPSVDLFEVHMSETSTAEEEELKEALDKGVDVAQKVMDMISNALGDKVDKVELLDYLNKRILKMNIDIKNLIKGDKEEVVESIEEIIEKVFQKNGKKKITNTDLKAFLPNKEGRNEVWESRYKFVKVKVESQLSVVR